MGFCPIRAARAPERRASAAVRATARCRWRWATRRVIYLLRLREQWSYDGVWLNSFKDLTKHLERRKGLLQFADAAVRALDPRKGYKRGPLRHIRKQ